MSNLSLRENAAMYLLLLVVIGLAAYIFGIRTLNSAYAEMQAQLITLQQQKEYLDQLKENNVNTENAIEELKNNIIDVERSFIADIKTENIEQYVLKQFEEAGIPFMATIGTESVPTAAVAYADGSASQDSLMCRRVNVTYATTDGYEITQFNTTPDMKTETGDVNTALVDQIINMTGIYDSENHYGYEEFLAALKAIERADKNCIRINSITAQSTYGYLTLTAAIDFYSADLTNRISTENRTAGYAVWKGETNVDTEGGFIGMPYYVFNEKSAWDGVYMPGGVSGMVDRPFASYLSNAYFTQLISSNGFLNVVGPERQVVPHPEEVPAEQ